MDSTAEIPPRPSLDEIRAWPPTVSVPQAARAFGTSKRTMYEALARPDCPVQSVRMNHRIHVITASLVQVLQGTAA
jgi:hypothetical protein